MKHVGAALLLISGLAAVVYWLQPEPPPPPKELPPPPPTLGLDPRDAPALLERWMARFEKADPSGARFEVEARSGILEARLLAVTFPDVVTPLLERIAGDAKRPPGNRVFAIRILGLLAGTEETLARLAKDPKGAAAAIDALYPMDLRGAHLELYREAEAWEALSRWPEAAPKKLSEPAFMTERRELLQAPDWAQRLEEILREPGSGPALWALQAARARSLPGLAGLLRERLDSGIVDDFGDDVLVALLAMGGDLTDEERRRLERSGYLGDPAARLAELLAAP